MIGLLRFVLAVWTSASGRSYGFKPRGAPRIRGELLKLGFEVAQSSVAK
jgi:hypothetical protein